MLNLFFRWARWASRVGSLLFATFVALFALDVFGNYQGVELAIALAMHLTPAAVVLACSLAGWRWPIAGAIGFLALGVGYVLMVGLNRPLAWYLAISGPAFLLAALYLTDAILSQHCAGRTS
jgi:hypothetical protein